MNFRLRPLALLTLLALPLSAQDAAGGDGPARGRVESLMARARDAARAAAAGEGLTPERKGELEARAARFDTVLSQAPELRAQVLFSEVVEKDGKPALATDAWRAGAEYFYPASTIKLFAAVVALERMRELQRGLAPGLGLDTPLAFYGVRRGGPIVADDADNLEGGKLTLRHLVREALIVSDNESFNRLYEFCGQDRLNKRLWACGLGSARISHRLSIRMSLADNQRTPAIELRLPEGPIRLAEELGQLQLMHSDMPESVIVGKQRMENGELVPGPMSFMTKNGMSLSDLQLGLARVVRPDLPFASEAFDLGETERALVLEALSQYPGDSPNPRWERASFPDDYAKFFLPGVARVIPKERIRIYNKVGLAYGFAIDNAYIVDTQTGAGFFLAATVYANSDGVIDDNLYDYESFALPWMADLAELCAREVFGGK